MSPDDIDAGRRRTADSEHPPAWAAPLTILFGVTVPGTALVLVPYWLTRWRFSPPLLGVSASRWLGVAIILVAAPILFQFLARFVYEGYGTPAPFLPPSRLVVGGPFRYVRNPGYVSVVLMILGQGLLFASSPVLVYAVLAALGFHLFVILYEEPTLRSSFGADYDAYCREVPRWIPRVRGRRGATRAG